MSVTNTLQLVNESGWRSGFKNMLHKENNLWWGRSRQWLLHGLIWLLLINGILAFTLWAVPAIKNSDWIKTSAAAQKIEEGEEQPIDPIDMFMRIMGITTVFGVIIIAQSTIVGEKQSGTAEWVFSNPVSRPAFILSKFIANTIGVFVTIIVIQGIVAYILLGLYGGFLPILPYIGAMGLLSLQLLFYLTLTLMLGVFFNGRGPVLGISFGIFVGQFFVKDLLKAILPRLAQILPVNLPEQATQLVKGEPIVSIEAIIITALCSIIFMVAAIIRFQREEFL